MATLERLSGVASLALMLGFSAGGLAGSVPDGTPPPPAQDGVNISIGPKAPAQNEPIQLLQMSSDLLNFGRQTKDPLALLVAARVIKALGSSETDRKPEGRTAEAPQKAGQPVTADSILAEARELAKGDKIFNLLIDEAAAMPAATFEEPP